MNSQKGGEGEAEHPNSHRLLAQRHEEFEGTASSFWHFFAVFLPAGLLGEGGSKALLVWRILVPGAERGSPLALLPSAFLDCLGIIP